MSMCAECAARFLVSITGGEPESALPYDPTDEDPAVNTLTLVSDVLDALCDGVRDALADADDAAFDAASEHRRTTVLIYADALRSRRFAEAVWLHIATRAVPDGPDEVAEEAV